ncbi:foldase [Bacillus sp. TS-2]|nr:foldase [Bacillus sp. TS-2]
MKKQMLAAVGLAAFTVLAACNNDEAATDDTPVVVVNGEEITEGQLVNTLKERYAEATLQEMVQRKLLNEQLETAGITDEEIQEELDYFRSTYQVEDDEALLDLLNTQFNIQLTSIDQLIDEYIIPPLVIERLGSQDVDITEEEKRAYFEENEDMFSLQVEASHILVEEESEAEEILEKINDGEDFAELAQEHSTDGSAANGGSVGFFGTGQMLPEFEEAAFELEIDEVSEIVQSPYGYHIIKVTDRKESYEDFEAEIEEALAAQQAKTPNQVLEEIISNADIDVRNSQYEDLFDADSDNEETAE